MKLHILALLLAPALRLEAQDSALRHIDSMNEVVVTGVSRAISIRENPVAIVGISSKAIDRTVEPNLIDALVKNVPGLSAVKTGPNISKPFIRGLGYNRVLTLYDGMRQEGQQWGDEHGIEADAYNIDKAEVIKGPASLMFGSDAVAGVVSLFPWLPNLQDGKIHGRVLSEWQSNNGLLGEGMRLGYRSAHWRWAVRSSWRRAKNYTNAIDGRVYNTGFREANAAFSSCYTSSKGSSLLHFTLYDNLQGIPDGSRDSVTRRFTRQVQEAPLDDIRTRPIVPAGDLDGYTLSPLHQHIRHFRLYTNNHYRLGAGEIDATLGIQQNIRREYNHPTLPQQAGLYLRLNTLNYGLRFLAPAFSHVELSAGVNGMLQDNKSLDATDFPIPDYRLLDIGAYVYGKWKNGPLTLSGGLREDTRQLHTYGRYGFTALNKLYNGLSLSAGAAFQLTTAISLKANIASGYRSPGITELASHGLDPGAHIIYLGNPGFVPEMSLQQDLGITCYLPALDLSCSIFNNTLQHYIYLSQVVDAAGSPVVDPQGNKTFQYQQAASRLYGAEGTLHLHPPSLSGFTIDNTIALTYGSNTNPAYRHTGIMGEFLPLIPPARWISGIGQEIKPSCVWLTSLTLHAELEYNAAQHRYLSLYNTETATPGYALINLSAGTAIKCSSNTTLQLQLQVNNLTDLAYQNNLSRLKYFEYFTVPPGSHSGIYNMGRNMAVKIIAGF